MATVYRAHDTALNRAVAIKVLDPALAMDPRAVERFREWGFHFIDCQVETEHLARFGADHWPPHLCRIS